MIIRREALQAALAAVSPDDTRYFLAAVCVEPSGKVVATNGAILLIATDKAVQPDEDFPLVVGAEFKSNPDHQVLIDGELVKRLIAGMPKKRRSLPILDCVQISTNGAPGAVTVASTDLAAPTVTTITKNDDHTFPRYENILPDFTDRKTVTVAIGLPVLESLLKAAKSIGTRLAITFELPADKPELVDAFRVSMKGDNVDVSGVAMPCRV